jgi:hypothetical protein
MPAFFDQHRPENAQDPGLVFIAQRLAPKQEKSLTIKERSQRFLLCPTELSRKIKFDFRPDRRERPMRKGEDCHSLILPSTEGFFNGMMTYAADLNRMWGAQPD